MLPDRDLHDINNGPFALAEGPLDSFRHARQQQR